MGKDTITKVTEDVFWAKDLRRLVKKSRPIMVCSGCIFYAANFGSCVLKQPRGALWCSDCIFVQMDGPLFLNEEIDI